MQKILLRAFILVITVVLSTDYGQAQVWNGTSTTSDAWREGKVGIGSSPQTRLNIAKDWAPILRMTGTLSNDNAIIQLLETNNSTPTFGFELKYNGFNNRLEFNRYDASSTSQQTLTMLRGNGYIGIGTNSPQEKLHVYGGSILISDGSGVKQFKVGADGFVRARQIEVDLQTIPDYVFEEDYSLMSLEALDKYIAENRHLPGISSAAEYEEKGGLNIGELQVKLLEKVEELTLHLIQLNKENQALQKQVQELEEQLDTLESTQINELNSNEAFHEHPSTTQE